MKCRFLGFSSTNLDSANLGKDLRDLLAGDSGAAGQKIALGETEPYIPSDTVKADELSSMFPWERSSILSNGAKYEHEKLAFVMLKV